MVRKTAIASMKSANKRLPDAAARNSVKTTILVFRNSVACFTVHCASSLQCGTLTRLGAVFVFVQEPAKRNVAKRISKDAKKSQNATVIWIVVYIAIQAFLPMSHEFTPVSTIMPITHSLSLSVLTAIFQVSSG